MLMKYWIDSRPADGSGRSGDFAECVHLSPLRRAFIVGDIAGRGHPACDGATSLRGYVKRLVARRLPLTTCLREACNFFTRLLMNDATPIASLFIAIADLEEGVLHYASAGHEPGLLFDGNGARAHEHLDPTGPVFGLGPVREFGQRTLPLSRENLLVVVTDGITEAHRREDDRLKFFGSSGVVRAVRAALREGQHPAQAICTAAVDHADGRLSDDACVIVSSLSFPNRVRLRPSAEENYKGEYADAIHDLLVAHEDSR
jgi:serine phosphatase RsbU (regulator of sigma subunit)